MLDKIKSLLSSIRFWMLTLATLSVLAGHYVPDMKFLFDSIATWLGLVTGVGTADKIAKSLKE